jgi:hypothetical protein
MYDEQLGRCQVQQPSSQPHARVLLPTFVVGCAPSVTSGFRGAAVPGLVARTKPLMMRPSIS